MLQIQWFLCHAVSWHIFLSICCVSVICGVDLGCRLQEQCLHLAVNMDMLLCVKNTHRIGFATYFLKVWYLVCNISFRESLLILWQFSNLTGKKYYRRWIYLDRQKQENHKVPVSIYRKKGNVIFQKYFRRYRDMLKQGVWECLVCPDEINRGRPGQENLYGLQICNLCSFWFENWNRFLIYDWKDCVHLWTA